MDFLGIGPLELLLILIIILVVMGPKDIVKSSKTVGKILHQIMTSPTFRLVQDTSREIRNLPYRLARESGMEELQDDLRKIAKPSTPLQSPTETPKSDLGAWGSPEIPDQSEEPASGDLEAGEAPQEIHPEAETTTESGQDQEN